ncbi:MAG: prohibitin family protein [Candidatus Methylacidiphilales bacterium]
MKNITPQNTDSPLSGFLFYAIIAAAVIGFFSLFYATAVVPPGHRGISVTLGKVNPEMKPEGFSYKIPFIETIEYVQIRQQTQTGKAACFSSDMQTVNIAFNIMYRIPENKVVTLFKDFSGDPYYSLIEPRVQETLKQVTAERRAEDLVKNREQVKVEALKKLKSNIGDLLFVEDLVIANIDLSDELEKAIEMKVVREQEALAKKFELEKAQKEGEITLVNAKADSEAMQLRGSAIKASPEVVQLEIIKKWDGRSPQVVSLGAGAAPGATILLPATK